MQALRLIITSLLMLLALQGSRAADAPALITLLEGQATVIAGARPHAAAVGARLAAGTLVETDAQLALLRLEWPDGSLLDLGPATKLMLRPPAAAGRKPASFYLLQGWAKQTQPAAGPGPLVLAAEVSAFQGVLVSQVDEGGTLLFSETGAIQLTPRRGGAALALKAGGAVLFAGNEQPQLLARPPSAWLQKVPRAFRETIAPRTALLKGPEPSPVPKPGLRYAALQPWLAAEPAVRRDFPRRFAELLVERDFRESVDRGLAQHPEWEPVLRPPPKPRPVRKNNDNPDQEAPR